MSASRQRLRTTGSVVRLYDEDPALFDDVSAVHSRAASARVTAQAHAVTKGPWDGMLPAGTDPVALLVLDGLLLRTVAACRRRTSELLGPGDVLRPWDGDGMSASVPFDVRWTVLERSRIAVIDRGLFHAASPWPEVVSALLGRAVQRAHDLALQLTIADLRRVEDRLLAALWHFADRWGVEELGGVTVPLTVSHEILAQLVSAQRPTVSAAMQRLQEAGHVRRLPDRSWLLFRMPAELSPKATAAA